MVSTIIRSHNERAHGTFHEKSSEPASLPRKSPNLHCAFNNLHQHMDPSEVQVVEQSRKSGYFYLASTAEIVSLAA